MTTGLLITLVLILINGFFVATEFALVKVRDSQLTVKIREGSNNAKQVQHILSHLDRYLSATQLGITLASLALGWIGESSVGSLIQTIVHAVGGNLSTDTIEHISFPIAFALLTSLHIIIGELLPKSLAIKNPLRYAMLFSRPLKIFYMIFAPFIRFLQGIFRMVMRSAGVDSLHGSDAHTEEELKLLLTESEQNGQLKASSNELIQNVFSFDDRDVRHIYTPRKDMSAIDIARESSEIISYMLQEGYSRYPVYEKGFDNMIGILHAKDMMQHFVLGSVTQEIIRRIVRPYHIVPLTQSIESLLHDMQTTHSHISLVQSEYGEIIGMVTMEDIIEELIGDVQDETDTEAQPYTMRDDGTRIVQGQSSVAELNEILPEPLPEDNAYTTLGGYLIFIRGRIPVKGEEIEDEHYTYRIESVRKHALHSIHMQMKKIENE